MEGECREDDEESAFECGCDAEEGDDDLWWGVPEEVVCEDCQADEEMSGAGEVEQDAVGVGGVFDHLGVEFP